MLKLGMFCRIWDFKKSLSTVPGKVLYNLSVNDDVKIYVMGYYNPFPSLTPILEANGVDLNSLVEILNSNIEAAVVFAASNNSASITYVPTLETMATIHPEENLVPTDFHPTIEGNKVIADLFWSYIKPAFPKE